MRIFTNTSPDPDPDQLDPRAVELLRRFYELDLEIIARAYAAGFESLARAMCHVSSFQTGADCKMSKLTHASAAMAEMVFANDEWLHQLEIVVASSPKLLAAFDTIEGLGNRALRELAPENRS